MAMCGYFSLLIIVSAVILIFVSVSSQEISDWNFDSKFPSDVGSYIRQVRATNDNVIDFKCESSDFITQVLKLFEGNLKNLPKNVKIYMKLFIRSGDGIRQTLIAENGGIVNLEKSQFDPAKKTVIITHGFLASGNADWISDMLKAYLKYEDVNVIVLDWGHLSFTINYVKAARNTQIVGEQAAKLLLDIMAALSTAPYWGPIHLIGHSLGAHVFGRLAYMFNEQKRDYFWSVERITGLDPAHPCFTDNKLKLDENDAPFVDIIHTNGNIEFGTTFGILQPIGHLDFYVNGGQIQPRCKWHQFHVAISICSHGSAAEYFTESLELASGSKPGKALMGFKWNDIFDLCDASAYTYAQNCFRNCQPLGIKATKPKSPAQYFVPAAMKKPFSDIKNLDREEIELELERIYSAKLLRHPLPIHL